MLQGSEKFVPDFRIEIGGTEQRDLIDDLISVEVEDSIDNPSMFSLVLEDEDGRWMDSSLLNPEIGGDVRIYMGYVGEKLRLMVTGKIVALNPDFPSEEAQNLTVQGYDHSFFLQKTHSLESPSALKGKDISSLVSLIAGKNHLACQISDTGIKYSDIVLISPGESDYSFIRRMADMAGFEFFVRDRVLHFRKPAYSGNAITLSWGEDISSMNFRMSTARAVKKATILGYNPMDKKSYLSEKKEGRHGIFSGKSASRYLANSEFESQILEQNIILNSQADIDILGAAIIDRANNSLVEGECEILGDPSIRAGRPVKINGAGKRFSGSYYIKSARHTIGEEGYVLHLGLMSMVAQSV
jgi:phage protein D